VEPIPTTPHSFLFFIFFLSGAAAHCISQKKSQMDHMDVLKKKENKREGDQKKGGRTNRLPNWQRSISLIILFVSLVQISFQRQKEKENDAKLTRLFGIRWPTTNTVSCACA
jgi:hypothetical protein